MAKKRRNIRIKPRFFIVVGVFALVVFLLIRGISALVRGSSKIEWGSLSTDETVSVLIVRKESVLVSSEQASGMSAVAAEGEKVETGEEVLCLYTAGYSEKDRKNYISVQQKIKDAQENDVLRDVADPTLDGYNDEIDALQEEIASDIENGDLGGLPLLERELAGLQENRRAYMKEITASGTTEYLAGLYQSETELEERLEAACRRVTAQSGGLVSYYIDGYEEKLTPESVAEFLPEDVNAILEETQTNAEESSGTSIETGTPLARVVDDTEWYALMVLPKDDNTLVMGQDCTFSLVGASGETFSAHVIRTAVMGSECLVTLRVEGSVGRVLSVRKTEGTLGSSAEGYRVPNDSISYLEDGSYITVRSDSGTRKVRVNVLAADHENSIVEPAEPESITVGMRLVKP